MCVDVAHEWGIRPPLGSVSECLQAIGDTTNIEGAARRCKNTVIMVEKADGKGSESHYFTRHAFVMHRVITHLLVMLRQQV